MAGQTSRKALLKAIDLAFSSASPNALSLPLPEPLLAQIEQFQKENNNDEAIKQLIDLDFSHDLYQICSQAAATNKKNQVVFIHILALLSPYILHYKSLLYWVNQCLTNALNSPGIPNDLVLASRHFLKSVLTNSHLSFANTVPKSYEKLANIRLRNSCYLFRILLNIYFNNDLNFYKHNHVVSIRVTNDLTLSTKLVTIDPRATEQQQQQDKQSQRDQTEHENVKQLESHEAKRFINLNIRALLQEFMIYDAKLGFEIFDDYIKDPEIRLDVLSLIMNLLCQQANILNIEILKSDLNSDLKVKEKSFFHTLVEATSEAEQRNRSDISSEDLKNKIINIHDRIRGSMNFNININEIIHSNLFRSICNCLLYDNDVLIINYSLLILVTIVPNFVKSFNKIIPLLLIIYARLITWNKNLKVFVSFKYDSLQAELDERFKQIISISNATDFDFMQHITDAYLKNNSDSGFSSTNIDAGNTEHINNEFAGKNSVEARKTPSIAPSLLNNSDLTEWTVVYKNINGAAFEYKSAGKLFTLLYGLVPNCLFEFLKSPLDFCYKQLGIELNEFIESEHLSFFNDAEILLNSKAIASNHLFNPDLLTYTANDELGDHFWEWEKEYKSKTATEILWHSLKFDRNVSLEFHFPPDSMINQNILKLFFDKSVDLRTANFSAYEKKLDNVNELFRLINLYKVELYGYDFNYHKGANSSICTSAYQNSAHHNSSNNNNAIGSPLTLASMTGSYLESPALGPNDTVNSNIINRQASIFNKHYTLNNNNNNKQRKHSIVSTTSDSIKDVIESSDSTDILSILNKQEQLFSNKENNSSSDKRPDPAAMQHHNHYHHYDSQQHPINSAVNSPTAIPHSSGGSVGSVVNSPKFVPLDAIPSVASWSHGGQHHSTMGITSPQPTSAGAGSSAAAAITTVGNKNNISTSTGSANLLKLQQENKELGESLKYYKRELLLLDNDLQFTNLVRLINNNELEKLKNKKFTGFLDATKANKLELLKHEDLKSQRIHLMDSYKKISREYAITLSRKRKNDTLNLNKIKELRDENLTLEMNISEAKKEIEDQRKSIAEFKRVINDKDTLIINLQNGINYLKAQEELAKEAQQGQEDAELITEKALISETPQLSDNDNVNVNNEQSQVNCKSDKQFKEIKDKEADTISELHGKINKLYEKKEYFKGAERKARKELKILKKGMNGRIEELTDLHNENLKELQSECLSILESNNKEIKQLKHKVKQLSRTIVSKNQDIQRLNKQLFEHAKDCKPISIRDDIPTYTEMFFDDRHSVLENKSLYTTTSNNNNPNDNFNFNPKSPKTSAVYPNSVPGSGSGSGTKIHRKLSISHSHHPLQIVDNSYSPLLYPSVSNNSTGGAHNAISLQPTNSNSNSGNNNSTIELPTMKKLDLSTTRQPSAFSTVSEVSSTSAIATNTAGAATGPSAASVSALASTSAVPAVSQNDSFVTALCSRNATNNCINNGNNNNSNSNDNNSETVVDGDHIVSEAHEGSSGNKDDRLNNNDVDNNEKLQQRRQQQQSQQQTTIVKSHAHKLYLSRPEDPSSMADTTTITTTGSGNVNVSASANITPITSYSSTGTATNNDSVERGERVETPEPQRRVRSGSLRRVFQR